MSQASVAQLTANHAGAFQLRRSVHFVPSPNERMLQKAIGSRADALILDLEDAVAPAQKKLARRTVREWLRTVDFGTKEVMVRINSLRSPWGLDDLETLAENPPDVYVVPKPEYRTDIELLDSTLATLEFQRGHRVQRTGLLPIATESPLGVLQLAEIASAPRIRALTWGAEDLAAALSASSNRSVDGQYHPSFELCRSQVLFAAVANNVDAIDAVFVDLKDAEGLIAECRRASNLGFSGKLSIHPAQIEPINEAFTPTQADVQHAGRLVEAFAEARRQGVNAIRFEDQMVDQPHLIRAERVLARARLAGVPHDIAT